MATDTIFIYTMNRGVQGGAWGRYVFPWTVEHFAHLDNDLYMRHGDDVSFTIHDAIDDDGSPFDGVIQWPWLDFGRPGVDKTLFGVDIVCDGQASIEIGYNQTEPGFFTESFLLPEDTIPGQIIGIPVMAPTMSVRLTFAGPQDWQWTALQMYFNDTRLTS